MIGYKEKEGSNRRKEGRKEGRMERTSLQQKTKLSQQQVNKTLK